MIQYLYLGRVPYVEALDLQAEISALRLAGRVGNVLLLLEHPPVLTLGRNAHRSNILASGALLAARGVTLHEINRGGDVTYHGPGQLVGYPIFDLRSLKEASTGARMGPVDFVRALEEALIRLCAGFGVTSGRIKGLTGVWCSGADVLKGHDLSRADKASGIRRALAPAGSSVEPSPRHALPSEAASTVPENETRISSTARKIAAIGIHVSRGIVTHGFAFNLNPDLAGFDLIVPCGIRDHAVTSLEKEIAPGTPLPSLESLANQAARQFGLVFSQPILAVESLAALRAQAAAAIQQPPTEDTPLRIPAELERLHNTPQPPVRA
jgi:lipoyl(octanoyl) transferase